MLADGASTAAVVALADHPMAVAAGSTDHLTAAVVVDLVQVNPSPRLTLMLSHKPLVRVPAVVQEVDLVAASPVPRLWPVPAHLPILLAEVSVGKNECSPCHHEFRFHY